ncbi:hypothetical protein AVEN_204839-1 [Araneus ventricosus]|uniref:Uncharacterized protein n=1 Tax=Araneus ventricosus TaxID=182803 RepID=A0A4Y2V4D1_ARAVE|nr:hypothetical protein AVEN_204839-1 [Araneus ventricosus]
MDLENKIRRINFRFKKLGEESDEDNLGKFVSQQGIEMDGWLENKIQILMKIFEFKKLGESDEDNHKFVDKRGNGPNSLENKNAENKIFRSRGRREW